MLSQYHITKMNHIAFLSDPHTYKRYCHQQTQL